MVGRCPIWLGNVSSSLLITESDLATFQDSSEFHMDVYQKFYRGFMKRATTKPVLLEAPNQKLPHLMSLTPSPSTRKITRPCLPGKFEIGYLAKAYAHMIMCPALVRLTEL